ncbi:hypothetical protein RD1_2371 [Roseobacter denitrificans OCh 114]|uniref:Uncharacterized protein n=1 Tax=Roseobacter denitrificans (strain ATCC 33942 / OCh 114) TaxID=375451 RepID=Q166Z9_ROSDO|nr:hypothetical protein RD1_2371 [Roseobacter denitrificans OCh 114]
MNIRSPVPDPVIGYLAKRPSRAALAFQRKRGTPKRARAQAE